MITITFSLTNQNKCFVITKKRHYEIRVQAPKRNDIHRLLHRDKMDEGYDKCPEFWDKEYGEKYSKLFTTMIPENDEERAILENNIGMYALCVDNGGEFQYWIAGEYKGGSVPEGFSLYSFPESEWALFSTKGPSLLPFRN